MKTADSKSTIKYASKTKKQSGDVVNDTSKLFFVTVANTSWQLAVSVLFFTFGGYWLDTQASSKPLFLAMGLLLAVASAVLIVRKQLIYINSQVVKGAK